MKEYTIIYNVQLTYIEQDERDTFGEMQKDPAELRKFETMLSEDLGADDVKVKGVKVFEREV